MKLLGFKIEKMGNNTVSREVYKGALDVKNNMIKMLEAANQRYIDMNNELLKQLKTQNKGTIEERMLDTAIQLFTPKNNNSLSNSPTISMQPTQGVNPQSTLLESGVEYSEEQIRTIVNNIPKSFIPQLAKLSDLDFANQVKQRIPDISETSILKAYQIVKEVAN